MDWLCIWKNGIHSDYAPLLDEEPMNTQALITLTAASIVGSERWNTATLNTVNNRDLQPMKWVGKGQGASSLSYSVQFMSKIKSPNSNQQQSCLVIRSLSQIPSAAFQFLNALICNHPLQKTIHPGEPGGGLQLDLDIVCTNLLFERLTKILTKTACGEAMLNGPFARTLNFILFFFFAQMVPKNTDVYFARFKW